MTEITDNLAGPGGGGRMRGRVGLLEVQTSGQAVAVHLLERGEVVVGEPLRSGQLTHVFDASRYRGVLPESGSGGPDR